MLALGEGRCHHPVRVRSADPPMARGGGGTDTPVSAVSARVGRVGRDGVDELERYQLTVTLTTPAEVGARRLKASL